MGEASAKPLVVVDGTDESQERELAAALGALGAPGRVVSRRDYDDEADRAALELARELVDAAPAVIRRRLREFAQSFPRRSGLVREYAIELDAERQAVRLIEDPDTAARVDRLLRAAEDYLIAGEPSASDERAQRLRALRGRRRSGFKRAWWRLLDAAEFVDPDAREAAERRVRELQPDPPADGDVGVVVLGSYLREVWDVVSVVVHPAADALVPALVTVALEWLRERRRARRPLPEVVEIVDARGRVLSRVHREQAGG